MTQEAIKVDPNTASIRDVAIWVEHTSSNLTTSQYVKFMRAIYVLSTFFGTNPNFKESVSKLPERDISRYGVSMETTLVRLKRIWAGLQLWNVDPSKFKWADVPLQGQLPVDTRNVTGLQGMVTFNVQKKCVRISYSISLTEEEAAEVSSLFTKYIKECS
jgi:hypothetical protein